MARYLVDGQRIVFVFSMKEARALEMLAASGIEHEGHAPVLRLSKKDAKLAQKAYEAIRSAVGPPIA
jgi:hypothetical protein